jgi:hypothetical protein
MFSVDSPSSRLVRCSVPNRSPVRKIADSAFCAAMVPSITSAPSRQTSQLPQRSEVSPK